MLSVLATRTTPQAKNNGYNILIIKHRSLQIIDRLDTNGRQKRTNYLRELDEQYMSWGYRVHYQKRPIIAHRYRGETVTDINQRIYRDTPMWHSSVNNHALLIRREISLKRSFIWG